MKRPFLFVAATAWLSLSLSAADSNPKDEIKAAAKALGEKPNYSWRSTMVVPADSPFKPGPTEGRTEKGGFTSLSITFNDNNMRAVLKGEKAAVTNPEGGWDSLSELENAEGPRRFMARMFRTFRVPSVQVSELVSDAKELKKDGEAYVGDLTEEGAKTALLPRARGGGDGPSVSNAQGSVKFWLKEGALVKFEVKVKGTVSFNGNDRDVDRITTTEIKDVGTTKVEVPAEAKKKFES